MSSRRICATLVAFLALTATAQAAVVGKVDTPKAAVSLPGKTPAGGEPTLLWGGGSPMMLWPEVAPGVAPDDQYPHKQIAVQRLTPDGAADGPGAFVSDVGAGSIPHSTIALDAAYGQGRGVLVAATTFDFYRNGIWLQRLDEQGRRAGDAIELLGYEGPQTNRAILGVEVGWNPAAQEWNVVWLTAPEHGYPQGWARELRVTAIKPDGTLGSTVAYGDAATAVEPSIDGGLLTWREGDRVLAHRIGADAAPVGTTIEVGSARAGTTEVVRAPNGDWLVVWGTEPDVWGEPTDFYARLYAPSGAPRGTARLLGRRAERWGMPSVAANQAGYLVAWHSATGPYTGLDFRFDEAFVRALDPSGNVLDTEPGQATELPHPEGEIGSVNPSVAGDPTGTRFTLVAHERAWPPPTGSPPPGWPGVGLYGRALAIDGGPETTIAGAPQDGYRAPAASIALGPASGATFQCRRAAEVEEIHRNADWGACASPFAFAGMTSSTLYHFEARATQDGWRDLTPARASWRTGDFTPPTVSFPVRPPRLTTARRAVYEVESDEDGTIICRVDGGAWTDCTPGRVEINGLGLGEHVFEAVATDRAGNVSAIAQDRWTVFTIEEGRRDTTPPPGAAAAPAPVLTAAPAAPAPARSLATAKARAKAKACAPRSKAARCVAARKRATAKAKAKAKARAKARATARARAKGGRR